MSTQETNDTDTAYAQRKHDYIPLSSELITHVRRLDGLDVSLQN